MKGFVAILLLILFLLAGIAALVLYLMYKGVRNFREVQEQFYNGKKMSRQEYIRYQREQSGKNPFSKDYFKSSGNNSKKEKPKTEKQNTTRRTTTSSGVTIIDDRETEDKKKIFDNNDGEYVEFEEVSD